MPKNENVNALGIDVNAQPNPQNTLPSSDGAMRELACVLSKISEDSKRYYLKNADEVTNEVLMDVDTSSAYLSDSMEQFAFHWFGSRLSGPDAVELSKELKDRIDIKLIQTGKLDFKQFGRIINRLHRNHDALFGLSRCVFYTSYYTDLCAKKNLVRQKEHAELPEKYVLKQAEDSIKWDTLRLEKQLERCSLHFQSKIKSDTFKVAFVSLLISSMALLVTVLNSLLK
jgi:hypothetical protein